MIRLDDRLLILEVRVACLGGCQRGLESHLPKGSVGWSGDETQMTKDLQDGDKGKQVCSMMPSRWLTLEEGS